jgi:glutathione S-transferase
MMAAASFSILDYLGDIDWNQYEDVKEWYALMKSRPSFRSLLADRISGLKPPAYYENPDF